MAGHADRRDGRSGHELKLEAEAGTAKRPDAGYEPEAAPAPRAAATTCSA